MRKKILGTILFLLLLFIMIFVGGNIWHPNIPDWRVKEAISFCRTNNLNNEYAIFVDFSLPSGIPRYMLYDFKKRKIIYRCLCASGMNKDKFSNQPGSHLSSLGKYKVTDKIHRMSIKRDGIIVKGLESTNSNAKSRLILIHHSKTLDSFPKSIFPIPIMGKNISWGCFSITSKGMHKTRSINAPMLLWAYR